MNGRFSIVLAALAAVAVPAAAQHGHQQGHQQGGGQKKGMMEGPWREMNGFHSLLHLSHQPLMKSGDLAPARRNAGGLADAAEVWAKSTAPAECHAPANVGETLTALATEARAYAKLVEANGTDEEVKAALGKLHDSFEAAHKACMPMGKGKGMDHKGPPPGR
ncbi:MAG: hypothetical protein JNJ80_05170 [Gemmatimonadetes bacterium]|nr:hypothetical protein [Gemmatimonadota bacterium]MCC7132766.1 hypothetical protein [Gemmatimonadales bacterium]